MDTGAWRVTVQGVGESQTCLSTQACSKARPSEALGYMGSPSVGSSVHASAGDIRDMGSNLGWGRAPGQENGNPLNPLQYSCLENPIDLGAWAAIVYRGHKSQHDLAAE